MHSNQQLPQSVWRGLGFAAILLLLVTVVGISLISAGVFDPKPIGALQRQLDLDLIGAGEGAERVSWQIESITQDEYSLRLKAAWHDGESDIGYGLAIGNREKYLVVALSPLGYATVQYRGRLLSEVPTPVPFFPWQTWPHINLERESNDIWVDIRHGIVTSIRINGEVLIQPQVTVPGNSVGNWLESFGQGTEVRFDELQLFYPGTNL